MADKKNNFDRKTAVEKLNQVRERAERLQSVIKEEHEKDPNSESAEVLFEEVKQSVTAAIGALKTEDQGSSSKSSKASGKKRGNPDE